MKKLKRFGQQIIAILLCTAMLISQVNVVSAAEAEGQTVWEQSLTEGNTAVYGTESNTESSTEKEEDTSTVQPSQSDSSSESVTEKTTENTQKQEQKNETGTDSSEKESQTKKSSSDATTETVKEEETTESETVDVESTDKLDKYYKDGQICIYNYKQLLQIGTDNPIYTGDKDGNIGKGEIVKDVGEEITYASDGDYLLMNDIELDTQQIWTVSDDFSGTITGEESVGDKEKLYNKDKDTIYIYNPYQLMVLAQDTSEEEPVMSMDYEAEQFGMGQLIYPDGQDKPYLTYSKDHTYVISAKFDADKPELMEDQLATLNATEADGRDFNGQVVKTIGDKTYILIGNAEQLRKIGSGDTVYGAVYQAYEGTDLKWHLDVDKDGKNIMLYGGDADLSSTQNGNKDYTFGSVEKTDASLGTHKANIHGRCGVNQSTGEIDPNLDIDKATNQTYSSTANYIIFRDIDLSDEDWTPLMFSGNMIGAKASGQSTLWNNDTSVSDYSKATDFSSNTSRPVISGITVNQTDKMDGTKYIGIGFFATITNEINVADIGVSAGTVTVSNLILKNVDIENQTNTHKNTQTLISGLTSGLGWLVGGVVDLLVGVVSFGQVKLNLRDTLSALLNARAEDPTIYATGAFAGRLVGDVAIKNCDVIGNVQVSNINDRTGGFVGYAEGVTQYSGLSKVLGTTVDALSSLLNVIPGLGLGDLITILLKNALPVGDLIPTGYKNVTINDCNVKGLSGTLGQADKDYAGGFAGQQIGTIIKGCSVKDSTYTIATKEYGGGFSGICRDADIKGTLSSIGIELVRITQPQSLLLNCDLENCDVTVSGSDYQGGITGAQTNSYVIDCGATGTIAVKATGSYAGGVSGIVTVGWVTNLGKDEVADTSLLKTVGDLLTKLLSSNPEQAGMLLSLAGVAPSPSLAVRWIARHCLLKQVEVMPEEFLEAVMVFIWLSPVQSI